MVIEVLFPEICNLYGDLSNVKYLAEACNRVKIINTSLGDEPYFLNENPNFIYMGSMSEKSQKLVLNKLVPYRDRISELIDLGTPMLFTGNALEIFGKAIDEEPTKEFPLGNRVKALDIFPTIAKQKMMKRHNSLFLGNYSKQEDGTIVEIVGFKSQFTHSYGELNGDKISYLFNTTRGAGFDGSLKGEGIRINNFMATYILGPILILNPLFTRELLGLMGAKDFNLPYEDVAMEVYETRLKEFKDPSRGFSY